MMGSLSVLLAKSSSQLLRKTLAGDNQLDSWFTYIVLAGWVALMIFWVFPAVTSVFRAHHTPARSDAAAQQRAAAVPVDDHCARSAGVLDCLLHHWRRHLL